MGFGRIIEEDCYDEPRKKIIESYDIKAGIKKHTKVFLFVKETSNSDVYSVRWAAGFAGKI